ncbi:hypothetical protein PPROV_000713900 [Pycnococcus provasolii]|uniref:Uncharacterized protein n=1 Tax=Pycnococcus provasolii TaxID=41880 RepID=A0A830HRK6_9CHLO|nr:hypothetical protein PPROV_000713900 [Pycnococcus provasolii]
MCKLVISAMLCVLSWHLKGASANDPASSWLTYASFSVPASSGVITRVSTTWTIPTMPAVPFGSNAPGWWFGVQTAGGNGALIQPIMAYGYQGSKFSIFNGVFDWTDESWRTSPEVQTVKPGENIISELAMSPSDTRTYVMKIAKEGNEPITTPFTLNKRQTDPETVVYFVLEHQPITCKAYPTSEKLTFRNITVEVNGKVVTPTWEIHQEVPACNSRAEAVDAQTLEFTWSTKWRGASDENNYDVDTSAWPRKWWSAEQPGVTEEA